MMNLMSLFDSIAGPSDLRSLSKAQLEALAEEIRSFLITSVSRTGGHLGPNLGVVELTMAIHKVFNSPHDPIIFDTGHQAYVHKILTGRSEGFDTLRQLNGLSGYPEPAESEHDWVRNSHASTALSWAEGLAKGYQLRGEDRVVVAVVGDGALTGGMSWEALNNIAAQPDLKLVIIVNDNGRSYTPTVGGLATHLAGLRTDRRYENTLSFIKRAVLRIPVLGRPIYDLMHGFKTGVKDVVAPQDLFSDLGIKYTGPIDGHDLQALTNHLEAARQFRGPVIVHCITVKGKGFKAAEEHEEDRFHAVGQINDITGEPLTSSSTATWTSAFSEKLVQLGAAHPQLVAITAAMLHPTGLAEFRAAYPERTFDVGIAEQHAIVSAAGLARAGLHPVVAVYSTFLNRAFDQLLMDVALHRCGVTVVLDRAGITGSDGPSHNGMWDVSMIGMIPGAQLAAPRDRRRLAEALERAVTVDDAPTIIRFSKDKLPADLDAVDSLGSGLDQIDILRSEDAARTLILGYGQFAGLALEVGELLGRQGIPTMVADPLWALPVSGALIDLLARFDHVVTLEDNLVDGGLGQLLRARAAERMVTPRMQHFGIPKEFLAHASRGEVLARLGLTAQAISQQVIPAALLGSGEDLIEQRSQ